MKINEVVGDPTRQDLLIRMSGRGRKLSVEEIGLVLAKEFNVSVDRESLSRYVVPFNRILQEVNPTAPDHKERIRALWQKLAAELAHPVPRNR
jgi:hypothetical protein